MPKKKKTSYLQRPTLQFAPSPDQQQPPVLTPEFAVHNPITAKSVQVNDQSFNTWVSPQFCFNAGVKQRRSRHPSQVTQSLHKSKSFNESRVTRERSRRYKQLQFISEVENTVDKQILRKDDKKSKKPKSFAGKSHSDKSVDASNIERDIGEVNTPELQVNGCDGSEEFNFPKTNVDFHEQSCTMTTKSCESAADEARAHSGDSSSGSAIGCQNISNEPCRIVYGKLVNATLTPSKARPAVLAPDTPEVEYGLPLRQIQLRYGLRDRV